MQDLSSPPTEKDLQRLTRWAAVAFAARCARRVQPILQKWEEATPEVLDAVDNAITIAETSAKLGMVVNPLTAVRATTVAGDHAVIAAAREAARAATLASVSERLGPSQPAARAAAAAAEAHKANPSLSVLFVTMGMWSDFNRLLSLAREKKWTDETPVDSDLLGPLWVKSGDKTLIMSEDELLAVIEEEFSGSPSFIVKRWSTRTFRLNPGSATSEEIAELLLAIGDLFRAAGGKGLTFEISGGQVIARQEVFA